MKIQPIFVFYEFLNQFAFNVGPIDKVEAHEINANTGYGSQELVITLASSNEKEGCDGQ